jgi:hypothetical protein
LTKEQKKAKRMMRQEIFSVVLTKGLGVETRLNCTPAQQRAAAKSLTDQFIKQQIRN